MTTTIPSKKLANTYAHAYRFAQQASAATEHTPELARQTLAVMVRKAWAAIEVSDAEEFHTPSGNVKVKGRQRCRVERARLDALLWLLADLPGHPLGSTRSAVEDRLRRALYATEEPLRTAAHSYSHSLALDIPWG